MGEHDTFERALVRWRRLLPESARLAVSIVIGPVLVYVCLGLALFWVVPLWAVAFPFLAVPLVWLGWRDPESFEPDLEPRAAEADRAAARAGAGVETLAGTS